MAFVYLLDGGVTPALKNKMSAAFALGDNVAWRQGTTASLLVAGFVGLCGMILVAVSTLLNWARILGAEAGRAATEAQSLVPLLLVVFAVRAALSCVDAIYAARLEINKIQLADLVASPVALVALLLGLAAKFGLPALACAFAAPPVLFRSWLLISFLRRADTQTSPMREAWPTVTAALPKGLAFFGIKISEVLLVWLPVFVLARLSNLEEVARYSVIQRAASVPQVFVTALLPVYWPAFTMAWARGERAWLRKAIAVALGASLLAYSVYAACLFWFGPGLVLLWTHSKIGVSGAELAVFAAFMGIQTGFYWVSTFLHSISDFGFELLCHIGCLVTFLGLGVFLGSQLGVLGIAVSLLVGWAFACLVPGVLRTAHWLARPVRHCALL
jgi:O-antigen/teichoic acid export membrane protein